MSINSLQEQSLSISEIWINDGRITKLSPKVFSIMMKVARLIKGQSKINQNKERIIEDEENIQYLRKVYTINLLGFGGYSIVFSVPHPKNMCFIALKVSNFEQKQNLRKEVLLIKKIWEKTFSPFQNVVKPLLFYEDAQHAFLGMELMAMDLYSYARRNKISLPQIKKIFIDCLQGLDQMNRVEGGSVVHADIKLNNILVSKNEDKFILSDFGISLQLDPENKFILTLNKLTTICYRAPELFDVSAREGIYKVTSGVDIWSLGCVLFELYTGKILFRFSSESEIAQKIDHIFSLADSPQECFMEHLKNQCIEEPDPDFCDLLSKMIVVNPMKRSSIDEIFKHPFLQNEATS